jgi:putative ABC transport system permease protein
MAARDAGERGEDARGLRRQFGNQLLIKETARDVWGWPALERLAQEFRLAIRTLAQSPGFAVSAILVLALGSGATTAIFSIAYGVLLRDLPYEEPERLVTMGATLLQYGSVKVNAGAADYFDWRKQQQVFEDLALTRAVGNYNLTGTGEPERLSGARTTASLFSTLRAKPLLGRVFTEEERLDPGRASRVAVLSYGLWQRRFGGDPSIVGRQIWLNGTPSEVIGVMRPEFRYPTREFELWTPLYFPPDALATRMDFSYVSVGRLRPGVTVEQARAHMHTIAANLAREYPRYNRDFGVYVEPMLGELTQSVRPVVWVLAGAVGMLFLIGCVNLANLLLARAAGRQREFAVRAALGATRARLVRQFFIESLPVAAAGCAGGILAARWLLDVLIPMLPSTMPRVEEIGLHGPVLAASAGLSVLAAILISIVPALHATANIARGPARNGRTRDVLMIAEIAATVVLLVGAGLLMRSFANLRGMHPGFERQGVLSLHLAVNRATHGDDRGVAQYLERLVERVRAIPGVEAVGIVNRLPLSGQQQTGAIRFEGRDADVGVDWRSASGDYFRALGIPLLEGRAFSERDTADGQRVGIIDERVAREVFGNQSPIGKRFKVGLNLPDMPWTEIVGVVGHVKHDGLDQDPRPQIYWPHTQRAQDRMAMAVRTSGDPAALTGAVRAAIREVDPAQPLYDVRPMEEVVERTLAGDRLNLLLVGSFAGLALLLASVGLYGVVSQLSQRRRREFGIRLALGAREASVLGMVLREGLTRAVFGLGIGLVLAIAATRLLGSLLHGVRPVDAPSYAAAAAVLLGVVLAAAYLPARRAMKLDPAQVLKLE